MRIGPHSLLAIALVGCGIDAVGRLSGDGTTTPDADGGERDGSSNAEDGGRDDGGGRSDGATPDVDAGPKPVIYVTTATKLFTFTPGANTWAFVTDFSASPCADVDEAAVDANGNLYASSSALRALYKFDMTTFACSKIADTDSSWAYAYSFAPPATDAGTATLVGYAFRDFVLMDLLGNVTFQGSNALASQMAPSGDVVSMGNRLFVSVLGTDACLLTDCLLEVNPNSGAIVKNWGNFPTGGVYALGHWGGKIYGFKNTGEVHVVTLGASMQTTTLPAFDTGSGITGAASSPAAPTQ